MCVNPIKIVTNSKSIYLDNNPKLINYVPCGKCYECRKEKTEQLMVRAFYQDSDYVIFDTLTYSDENLKKYHDINVLYYPDYQKFMKRFRIKLKRLNVDVEDNIKYIVAGEYGTRFTQRPHLHLILFVKNCKLDPEDISNIIFDSWQNGITDGVKCKGIDYFRTKRLFTNYESKKNVVGYICKYMTKTGNYQCDVERKLFYDLWLRLEDCNLHMSNYELSKHINKVIKPYCQFVRWSKGFGKKFLVNDNNISKVIENGFLQISTDLKYKKYKVPLYYQRKISQRQICERNYLTNNGVKLKNNQLKWQFEYNKQKLRTFTKYKETMIEAIAYYWTYKKDRIKGRQIRPIKYNGEIYQCENSNLDRGLYENGKINDTTAKRWITDNIEHCEQYDKIIEQVNKYMNEEKQKMAKVKEMIYHNKKLINKL